VNERPVLTAKLGALNGGNVSDTGTSSYVRNVVVSGQAGLDAKVEKADVQDAWLRKSSQR
jgi:hypothetical protein